MISKIHIFAIITFGLLFLVTSSTISNAATETTPTGLTVSCTPSSVTGYNTTIGPLTTTLTYTDGTSKVVTSLATYTSSNTSVATIYGTTVKSATTEGSSTIIATYIENGVTTTGTCIVTVAELYASMDPTIVSYRAIPLAWNNNAGHGQIVLTWSQVVGASGYYVEVYDGSQWSRYDVGNTTIWDSSQGRIYPSESILADYIDNSVTTEIYRTQGTVGGDFTDLRDNPTRLYQKTLGTTYDSNIEYQLRVQPYSSTVTQLWSGKIVENQVPGPIGTQSTVTVVLPNRTDITAPTGFQLVEYDAINNYTSGIITITGKDTESGPNDIIPSSTVGLTLLSTETVGQYMTKKYKVNTNGQYIFTVKDNVGWTTPVTVNVTDINAVKPIIIFDKEGKVITEMHLSEDTQNAGYIKWDVVDIVGNSSK
ncbi:MAG TPA: hypothetical protein DEP72_07845 [Clostridiales bacterium]|nr:hypothetical protein [Clostridiales bacterium]